MLLDRTLQHCYQSFMDHFRGLEVIFLGFRFILIFWRFQANIYPYIFNSDFYLVIQLDVLVLLTIIFFFFLLV